MLSGFDRGAVAFGAAAMGVSLAMAVVLGARSARGDTAAVDPSYGRIDGDLGVVVGVGGVVVARGVRAGAEVRLRYLETAGLFATYEDGQVFGAALDPERVLAAGFEMRPLFLFRWLQGHELRRARLDLALDSIGLELGALLEQPRDRGFASRAGFEVGLGVELPILERVNGPWIAVRAALRWSEVALGPGILQGANDRDAVLAITLGWHQILAAHVVDSGDRAPR
jgi:hypothetical protein